MTPHFEAARVGERRFGVFFRVDARTSFGPEPQTFRTRREAERNAAERNRMERMVREAEAEA